MTESDADLYAMLGPGGRQLLGGFTALTEAQQLAIPQILAKRPLLLIARTASGKTEAVLAPLLTLHQRERWRGRPSVLHVVPTRALVNDLHRRLELSLAGFVDVGRRTGEYGETDAQLLITTPESLDSMLARGTRSEGHLLDGVRAVVIDELHLFAEGPRGTQLQVLLARLDEVAGTRVHRVGISATVPSPGRLAARFLGAGAVVCTSSGNRSLRIDGLENRSSLPERGAGIDPLGSVFLRVFEGEGGDKPLSERLLELRRELETLKALVFVPSRSRCDSLTANLTDAFCGRAPLEVHAHHGSLDRGQREGTERDLSESDEAVAVATSTLEVGIDIGDVGLVVLDGPPGSVSALLQRVGRGNRRSGEVFVLPVVRSDVEACVLASMLRAAVEGNLDEEPETAHFSVSLQQMASIMKQSRNAARRRSTLDPLLEAAFGPHGPWLVDQLVAGDWLRSQGTIVKVSPSLAEIIENPFQLHCNIDGGANTVPVVDMVTGQPLAWVPRGQQAERLVVAGTGFTAVNRGDVIEMAEPRKGGSGRKVRYSNRRAPVGRTALQHLRRGLGLPETALIPDAGGFVHFGGALVGRLLTLAGMKSGALRSDGDPRGLPAEAFRAAAEAGWQRLEPLCGFGPFQRSLPETVRKEAVLETVRAHDVPGWIAELTEPRVFTEEQRRVLEQA